MSRNSSIGKQGALASGRSFCSLCCRMHLVGIVTSAQVKLSPQRSKHFIDLCYSCVKFGNLETKCTWLLRLAKQIPKLLCTQPWKTGLFWSALVWSIWFQAKWKLCQTNMYICTNDQKMGLQCSILWQMWLKKKQHTVLGAEQNKTLLVFQNNCKLQSICIGVKYVATNFQLFRFFFVLFFVRDGCRHQNGWIFGKVPNGL